MKLLVFCAFFLLIIPSLSQAQISTGGNVGVTFEDEIMQADIAPEINYSFTEKIITGFSPFVLYTQNNKTNTNFFTFGARIYSEYKITQTIFIHAEYEISKTWTQENYKTTVHTLPIGAGFEKQISDGMVAYGMILYDILYDSEKSIRKNPSLRGGIRYTL
ncbi:MAG: hypothetical protein R6U95_05820 [Bacteroidales bacterium]